MTALNGYWQNFHGETECDCVFLLHMEYNTGSKIGIKFKESVTSKHNDLGGPEVSFEPEEIMLNNPFIDYIICGEGEVSFSGY